MIRDKSILMIPGPTPVAPSVTAAQMAPMINHRGEAFNVLFDEVIANLQQIFHTQQTVFVLPMAGTGGFETVLVNTLEAGATVLSLTCGSFGDRFASIAAGLGYRVEKLETEWGQAVDPVRVAERLAQDNDHRIKAVLITHNETSTGVTNDVQALAALTKQHGALALVDSVSGLAALPFYFDAWGIDAAFTGSQKALACPPGIVPVALSAAATARMNTVQSNRGYFDLRPYAKGWPSRSTPYTPAVSLWYALREALRLINEETLQKVWARHALLGAMARAGAQAAGLQLLVDDPAAYSNTVTAVKVPAGTTAKELRAVARKSFGVQLAGGQGKLEQAIFRIGHLGYFGPQDLISAVVAIELAVGQLGYPTTLGAAAAAAQRVWLEHLQAR